MEARVSDRRFTMSLMTILCAVLLLATSANGLVRGGLSGQWQDWGDGVWQYYYYAPTNSEYWRFASNQEIRFAYKCGPGQWWSYSQINTADPWSPIGMGGVGNDFLGDDHNWHVVDSEWSYQYWWTQDCGYWQDTSDAETRFAYKYGPGQWWDYTSQWGHMGLGNLTASADFIGDGDWHPFDTSNMAGENYLGNYADADFRYYGGAYYWRCAGIERYKFVYGTGYTGSWYWGSGGGTWYSQTYDGEWQNPDTRYHGGGIFIESGLAWDPGSDRPASVPSPRNIDYNVWNLGGGSWSLVTSWTINNPGSDNRWSGGDLNVLWCNTRHWDGSSYIDDFGPGYAEYTQADVVVFLADFEEDPIGFSTMVDWMTLVRDYFRQNIRTTTVAAHGSTTSWRMGQSMSTSNYTSFYSDWVRWGSLMTADAQLVSLHCLVGNATTMLNNIAAWSGCDIFANTNETWSYVPIINTSYERGDSTVWNHNMYNVTWRDNNQYTISRLFEFTTTGSQNYRWILYY